MAWMNGGDFCSKFIFGCFHSFSSFLQVFSMVCWSITNFGGAIALEKAPWRRPNRLVMDCDGPLFPAAIVLLTFGWSRNTLRNCTQTSLSGPKKFNTVEGLINGSSFKGGNFKNVNLKTFLVIARQLDYSFWFRSKELQFNELKSLLMSYEYLVIIRDVNEYHVLIDLPWIRSVMRVLYHHLLRKHPYILRFLTPLFCTYLMIFLLWILWSSMMFRL